MKVPFFRVEIGEEETREVVEVLQSGWLTSGPRVRIFESEMMNAVGAKHAIALNSCTAALHLALEALGVKRGDGVLVPTWTFAATAEVVRYLDAVPILVDCDQDGQMDVVAAERAIDDVRSGRAARNIPRDLPIVGVIPVHVGGVMLDMPRVGELARKYGLWVVEDAAHAFPAASRLDASSAWVRCGEGTSDVTCFSFYANKTITTGEGGMAVTGRSDLAERMRIMSLHGLSRDAWSRYSGGGWDYRIVAPGFKYNLTDVAAAIGIHQARRAETLRAARERIAKRYRSELSTCAAVELPEAPEHRIHAWHLFPLRLCLDRLTIDRNRFVDLLVERGVGCSVHWRPLHLHPYYIEAYGWTEDQLPVASSLFPRALSIPLFAHMSEAEVAHVVETVREVSNRFTR